MILCELKSQVYSNLEVVYSSIDRWLSRNLDKPLLQLQIEFQN